MNPKEHFAIHHHPTSFDGHTPQSSTEKEFDQTPTNFDLEYQIGATELKQHFGWQTLSLNQTIQFASIVSQKPYESAEQSLIETLRSTYPSAEFDPDLNQKIPARIFFHFFDKFIPQPENRQSTRKAIRQTEITPAEYLVTLLLPLGLGNKQIAARLKITEKNIRNKVEEIQSKLYAQNRTEAAILSLEQQLVPLQFILQRKSFDHFVQIQKLSLRKHQILELVSQGKTTNQIAQEIHLAPLTVRNYLSTVFHNLHCQNRTEAATIFYIATHPDIKPLLPHPLPSLAEQLDLTPREQTILPFLVRGLSNKTIAQELNLAEMTPRQYIASIFSKLGAKNRTHAAVIVLEKELISPEEFLSLPQSQRDTKNTIKSLTPLQKSILAFLLEGNSNSETAEKLHYSQKYIRNTTNLILELLKVDNRTQAAVAYYLATHPDQFPEI